MGIRVENISYEVEILVETGAFYQVTPLVLSLTWSEDCGQLAQCATLSLCNEKVNGVWLMSLVKLGCKVLIYSNWGEGRTLVFSGTIWNWDYRSSSQKELKVTAYDNLKYLMQSRDYGYYSAGQSTAGILEQICNQWEIPLVYDTTDGLIHSKKVFSNKAVSDMILELLEELSQKTGTEYLCQWKDEALTIGVKGCNPWVHFLGEHCTFSTSHSYSLNDLVSKVKVLGNGDDEGRSYIEAVAEGDHSFGVLQQILVRDSDKSLGEAQAEAQVYLEEHQYPREDMVVTAIDLPFVRKGHKVHVEAGDLVGDFFVTGVCHNGSTRTMVLTLEWASEV